MPFLNTSILGSFIPSIIARLRLVDNTGHRVSKPAAFAKPVFEETPKAERHALEIQSRRRSYVREPLVEATPRFASGHRSSKASAVLSSECHLPTIQEQASLQNFANTLRFRTQEYNATSPSKFRKVVAYLPTIEEETEDERMDDNFRMHESNLTPSPLAEEIGKTKSPSQRMDSVSTTAEVEEHLDAPPSMDVATVYHPVGSTVHNAAETIPSLTDEITSLRSQIVAADQEIQNLNVELANTLENSVKLIHKAEKRMEELLTEKIQWTKTQKVLKYSLSHVTDELHKTKDCNVQLELDNQKLKNMIYYHGLSLENLNMHQPLLHQEAIARYNVELPSPPSTAKNSQEKTQPSPDTIISLSSPSVSADLTSRPTPLRSPTLRRSSSRKLSGPKANRDGSPFKSRFSPVEKSSAKSIPKSSMSEEENVS